MLKSWLFIWNKGFQNGRQVTQTLVGGRSVATERAHGTCNRVTTYLLWYGRWQRRATKSFHGYLISGACLLGGVPSNKRFARMRHLTWHNSFMTRKLRNVTGDLGYGWRSTTAMGSLSTVLNFRVPYKIMNLFTIWVSTNLWKKDYAKRRKVDVRCIITPLKLLCSSGKYSARGHVQLSCTLMQGFIITSHSWINVSQKMSGFQGSSLFTSIPPKI